MSAPPQSTDPPRPPEGFIDRLRQNPQRAAETLAVEACRRNAPAAATWAAEALPRHGGDAHAAIAQTTQTHARYSRFEGAALGVGGFVTVLPDIVALAWLQARLLCHVAAAAGYDPADELRPAELLHLHGIYPTPDDALAAIRGEGALAAFGYAQNRSMGSGDKGLASRLAKMAGKNVAKRAAGRVVPLLGAVTGAVGNERETKRFAADATRFYLG